MILDVDPESGTVALLDVSVLTRFHVAVRRRREDDLDGVDLALRLAGAGRVAGAEVLVSIGWVRARGPDSGAPDWGRRFDEMVEFSAGRGWVEERPVDGYDGEGHDGDERDTVVPSLRVHCEWPAEPKFAVLDFTRTAHREGRVRDGFEQYTAPGLLAHGGPGTQDLPGRDAVLGEAERQHTAGSKFEIWHLLAEGDLVAVHALHTPPGASAGHEIVDLYRVNDGLIVEWWRITANG